MDESKSDSFSIFHLNLSSYIHFMWWVEPTRCPHTSSNPQIATTFLGYLKKLPREENVELIA